MTERPPEEYAQRGRRRVPTRYIAFLALAVAVGHVIYAILRDHVFHASPILG